MKKSDKITSGNDRRVEALMGKQKEELASALLVAQRGIGRLKRKLRAKRLEILNSSGPGLWEEDDTHRYAREIESDARRSGIQ